MIVFIALLLGLIAIELFFIFCKLDEIIPIEIRFIGEDGKPIGIKEVRKVKQ